MKKELLDRIKLLQANFIKIKLSLDLDSRKLELEKLTKEQSKPDFWENQNKAQEISKKIAQIENFINFWINCEKLIADFFELLEISENKDLVDLELEITKCEKNFKEQETKLLLFGEFDEGNAILSIQVGNGGDDAEDFSQILERMYLRFCERKNFSVKILDESKTDVGIRSVTISIKGDFAFGFLQSENGVHRLIRLSPFNSKNLRQTSFARVEILPEINENMNFEIDEKDLRIDVFRSSGAGGQSVNTTDSAVRITFLPLGISVSCQNERSQLQNKASAMTILKSRLMQLKLEQNAEKLSEIRGEKVTAAFGSQIRTYTLQPYKLVKDHRTNFENSNPEKIFDGELDGFIDAFLRKEILN
jgi:peptide chain release factor 2